MDHQTKPKASFHRRTPSTYRMDCEFGQGLVEYAIIIALVAVVVTVIAAIFGSVVK